MAVAMHLRRLGSLRWHSLRRGMATARYAQFGDPLSVLRIEADDPLPLSTALAPQQVSIRFLAAPIHVADLSQVQGTYGLKPKEFPAIAGNEGVAEVTAVGDAVRNVRVHDHVIPSKPGLGTWRDAAIVQDIDVMPISPRLSVTEAATLSVNPATAYRMLRDFVDLTEGDVIIQNGANSAVGQAVVQLAALRGIQSINIIRNGKDYEATAEHLKSLGATIVCADDILNFPSFKRLIADLPRPKLALNCIGGVSSQEMSKCLAPRGVHVTYGGMSKQPAMASTSALIFRDITLRGFWLSTWVQQHSVEEKAAMLDELAALVEAGKLRSSVQTFPFTKFEDALQAAITRTDKRKVVMLMEP